MLISLSLLILSQSGLLAVVAVDARILYEGFMFLMELITDN